MNQKVETLMSDSEEAQISPELYSLRERGALTATVLIQFKSDEDRAAFQNDAFEKLGEMDTMPVARGIFNLKELESLEDDSTIEFVEPEVQFSIPTDPGSPQ